MRIPREALSRLGKSGSAVAGLGLMAQVLHHVATLGLILLAAAMFSPSDFAVYSLSLVFMALVQTVFLGGLQNYIITSPNDEAVAGDTGFWLMLGMSTTATAVVLIPANHIASAFGEPRIAHMLYLLIGAQPLASLMSWASAMSLRRGTMRMNFTIQILQSVFGLVIGAVLIFTTGSIYALSAFVIVRILSGCLMFWIATRELPRLNVSLPTAKEALKFSSPLYGVSLLNHLATYSGDVLIGLTLSTEAAAIYRIGNRLGLTTIELIGQPLRTFAISKFGAAARNGRDLQPILQGFISTQTLVSGLFTALLLVFIGPIVLMLFGQEYFASIAVAIPFALRAFFLGTQSLVQPIFSATGQTMLSLRYFLVWTSLMVGMTFVVSPFGMLAMAWSQAVMAFFASAAALRLMYRELSINVKHLARSMSTGVALCLVSGLMMKAVHLAVENLIDNFTVALVVSMVLSGLILLGFLAIGRKIGIMHLHLFK